MSRRLRLELRTFAAFHVALALVILFAPERAVVTPGSIEAFRVLPHVIGIDAARVLWALAFGAVSVLIGTLSRRSTLLLQHVTWIGVALVDGIWAGAFIVPLVDGRGSAIAAILCPLLITWGSFLLVRVGRAARHVGDECG